ncbi:hypothetical protein ZWY2020_006070 [Hordeum vulgare]|nr:hypothetical protein ZWY2020_006070 [Hordeum vulgare]
MMNSTQEERDDAHDSFLQVKKGSVLVTRMESITTYQNQHRQPRSGEAGRDLRTGSSVRILRVLRSRKSDIWRAR